jgi:hypothetical protein
VKRALQATAFAISTLAAPAAWAQCVTVLPTSVAQIRLDPLNGSGSGELVRSFSLTFTRATTDNQPIQLRFMILDEDSSLRPRIGVTDGPTVVWQIPGSPNDIGGFTNQVFALSNSAPVVLGEDEGAKEKTVNMRLTDLDADLAAGIYREGFTVRVWCDAEGTSTPYDTTAVVPASVSVPNVLSANVAGASASGEIDFFNFDTLTRSLQLSVRSTGPYRVTAASLNGGALVREGASVADDADRIAYQASVGGQPVGSDIGTALSMPRAGLAGQQLPLEVTVDDVSDNRAGKYADTLLLTFEPAN